MPRHPARSSGGAPAAARRARAAPVRLASHHDGPAAGPAGSVPHVLIGDLTMLGLISGEEIIQGLQPPVMIGLQPQRVVHPRADALRAPAGDGVLGHGHQLGVHRRREPLLTAHTVILYLSYDRRKTCSQRLGAVWLGFSLVPNRRSCVLTPRESQPSPCRDRPGRATRQLVTRE